MPKNRDGNFVSMKDALDAWTPFAVTMLIATGSKYNQTITYKQLSEGVQVETGITHNGLLPNWIGDLLGRVISYERERALPGLTALCVKEDGTVGDGHRAAIRNDDPDFNPDASDILEHLDDHAAIKRLECYRFFDAEGLPGDGGVPTLTPKAKAARDHKKAQAKRDAPLKMCPKCHQVLPMTGQCDYCD